MSEPLPQGAEPRTVLVTGAAGRVGRAFAAATAARYRLRLLDRPGGGLDGLEALGETIACDIEDLAAVKAACLGVDTVVHLVADPDPAATWHELLGPNIIGAHHVFAAAVAAGCRRVVFASSIHAVMGYAPGRQVDVSDPVNPLDLYGVTKCFGEAMGRYVAEQKGLSVVVLRLGAVQEPEAARDPDGAWFLDMFLAPQDLVDVLMRAIDVEGVRFATFHVVSANPLNRLDLTATQEVLGYSPAHDLLDLAPYLAPLRDAFERRARDPRYAGPEPR